MNPSSDDDTGTASDSDSVYHRGRASVPQPSEPDTAPVRTRVRRWNRSWQLSWPEKLRPGHIWGLVRTRRPSRRAVSWTALVLALGMFVVAVLSAEGFPAADLKLNDGGVWVTYRN